MAQLITPQFTTIRSHGFIKPNRPFLDRSHNLSRGLIGFWPLGDGNKITMDISQNRNHGTLNNMSTSPWTSAERGGQAYLFDGSDDVITIPSGSHNILKTDPFSLSLRVKSSQTTGILCGTWQVSSTPGWSFGYDFVADSIDLLLTDQNGSNYFARRSNSTSADGTWKSWVATYDGSGANTGINLYLNGAAVAMTNVSAGSANPGTLVDTGFRIGARFQTGTNYAGSFDAVRLYKNRILNQQEAAWLHSEPYAGVYEASNRINVAAAFRPRTISVM